MSSLDHPYNDAACCWSQQPQRMSTLDQPSQKSNHADHREKQEVDTLLSDALNNLTFEERQIQQELVHGVHQIIAEEATFIESRLQELDEVLNRMKVGSTYEVAEQMNGGYVSARPFRLVFLRAKRYNSQDAADQMLRFFETKQKLFGKEKLVKDITMEDLDEDDLVCLRSGFLQCIGRDRADRLVVCELPGLKKAKTLKNELRSRYYMMMSFLENERNQIRGTVGVAWAVGEYREIEHDIASHQVGESVPLQICAIHFCTDEISKYTLCKMFLKIMPSDLRARFQPHFGSHLECSYQLSTYGISLETLQLESGSNHVSLDYHLGWFQRRLSRERSRSPVFLQLAVPFNPPNAKPTAADVLFIDRKTNNNGGNERLRTLVKVSAPAYFSGSEEKPVIIDRVIEDITKDGGRFLKKTKNNEWGELEVGEARIKVMQMFRNQKRKQVAGASASGTPIMDKPCPEDVVFGHGRNRGRGTEFMQQMISDRSKEYDALDRGLKKKIVEEITQKIKGQGGRFLQESPEGWVEVSHEEARQRISKYFRNKRRKK